MALNSNIIISPSNQKNGFEIRKIIFLIAILFNGILFAQPPYDPLTDTLLKKPGNTLEFDSEMSKKINAIRGESEFSNSICEQYRADFFKEKKYASVLQYVVVKNFEGNNVEKANNFEIAKQLYYQIVWNKNLYSQYPKEETKVGFYYYKTYYDLARLLSKLGDYKNSFLFFNSAAEFYKKDSSFYFCAVAGMNGITDKTVSFSENGNYIFLVLNKAIELKPNSAAYIEKRGEFYIKHIKDTAKAFSDFTKAVQLNPADGVSYDYLSIINYYRANLKEAINSISKSISINKDEPAYYAKRAFFYKQSGNYETALTDYDEAIFLDQTNARYYVNRAVCYNKIKKITSAYDDYGFATMLDPNDADSKSKLKELDPLLKSEYEKMGMTPQNAFQFFSNRADNYFKLSEGFRLGPAVMNYYKCIQIEPKNPVPYNKAGKIFQYLKMNKYAEQFLRYAAYADGKNPEYFFDLGSYYFNNEENYKAGSGCLDTAALLGSVNANAYYTNGLIKHSKLKNFNGALKDYNTALALDPSLKIAKEMRGLLYLNEIKDYKSALADFEALSKLDPQSEFYKNEIKECKEKLKG